MKITGKTLIGWGYRPGPWFAEAIAAAEKARATGADEAAIRAVVDGFAPAPAPTPVALRAPGRVSYTLNIRAEVPEDAENIASVERHMADLMRVPTLVAGAVMPDACPSGAAPGTIPVGGVVAAKDAIHPGFHSADICCSMAVTVLGKETDPIAVLDAGMKLSHFGGGGRARGAQVRPPAEVMEAFEANGFLRLHVSAAVEHFATQGDGNHFFYVGRVASSRAVAMVTHHGSRGPGAHALQGRDGGRGTVQDGRALRPRRGTTPGFRRIQREGRDYWDALQIIRRGPRPTTSPSTPVVEALGHARRPLLERAQLRLPAR